jgi:hypothetical protein
MNWILPFIDDSRFAGDAKSFRCSRERRGDHARIIEKKTACKNVASAEPRRVPRYATRLGVSIERERAPDNWPTHSYGAKMDSERDYARLSSENIRAGSAAQQRAAHRASGH